MLKIRVHHLLCMQGFQGKGYNDSFVKNMSKIVNSLRNDKTQKVQLVADVDNICSACPNNKNSICLAKSVTNNDEKISKEIKLIKALCLKKGEIYSIDYLFETVNRKINTKEEAINLYCKSCCWTDVCLWFKSLKSK